MKASQIRKLFLEYFSQHKKFPHTIVSSSSIVPANDSSVLFTTAGMQQFKPYFLRGKSLAIKEKKNTRFTSVQKCFRVSDIDEVGDETHCTFFEMLGNFSIGDYFSDEALQLAWEFTTKKLHIKPDRLWVTYFSGDPGRSMKEDIQTKNIWLSLGVPEGRIAGFGSQDNFWGPPGKDGPCGPCTEIHYDFTQVPCAKKELCGPNCSCGRFVEIWNIVLMQFNKTSAGTYEPLKEKNIDTGMGLERLAMITEDKSTIFETSLFSGLMSLLGKDSAFSSTATNQQQRQRIAADHLRASVILVSDGVVFGKKGQEAILRRIFKKAIHQFSSEQIELGPYINCIIETYKEVYPEIGTQKNRIIQTLQEEYSSIQTSQNRSVHQFVAKLTHSQEQREGLHGASARLLSADEAFTLYTTHGFSLEQLQQEGYTFDTDEVNKRIEAHKEISRQGAEKKFGGHGLDTIHSSDMPEEDRQAITRHHTATHLLQAALRKVLGDAVRQEGSDITPERLRFDFSFPRKITQDEKQKIASQMASWLAGEYIVIKEEMPLQQALAHGATAFFREKYPEIVSVYTIIHPATQEVISKELCGGPHVASLDQIGNVIIDAEKSVAKGIRRIKAHVEKKGS